MAKYILSVDDKIVKLKNKETKKDCGQFHQNIFGKIYWIDAEDNINFLRNDRLYKYEIIGG